VELGERRSPFRVDSDVRLCEKLIKQGDVLLARDPLELHVLRESDALCLWGVGSQRPEDIVRLGVATRVILNIGERLFGAGPDVIYQVVALNDALGLVHLSLMHQVLNQVREHVFEPGEQVLDPV